MRARLRLGRIAGVAVELSWTVLLIVGLLAWSLAAYTLPESVPHQPTAAYWAAGVLAALGLMASILAHELGHALVAKQVGVHVEEITLWLFGGIARFGQRAGDASEMAVIELVLEPVTPKAKSSKRTAPAKAAPAAEEAPAEEAPAEETAADDTADEAGAESPEEGAAAEAAAEEAVEAPAEEKSE